MTSVLKKRKPEDVLEGERETKYVCVYVFWGGLLEMGWSGKVCLRRQHLSKGPNETKEPAVR